VCHESTVIAADVVGREDGAMERVHEQPKSRRPRADVVEDGSIDNRLNATDLQRELDDLLDEVDAVLEENAEEFIKAYVQKGGE